MKVRQLHCVWEVVRHGNHVSAAAEALHTSQPGVSKQIQLLEAELGFKIFIREKNRITGLTGPGKDVVEVARRVLADVSNLRHIREEFLARDSGNLTVAATHTQARYVLPEIIERFAGQYPKVRIVLHQGNPTQICELVDAGEADVAIGTESARPFRNLVMLPCFQLSRSVVTKAGHPLLKVKKLTLKKIAEYPILTHQPASSGYWKVMSAFEKAGIRPDVISSAVDADVCKTYVERGLGIAILATVAFDRTHDVKLRAMSANHLFEPSTVFVSLRRNAYLRRYALDFLQSLAPHLTAEETKTALEDCGTGRLNHGVLRRL